MNKKILSMEIVSILVLSGLGAAAFTTNPSSQSVLFQNTESVSVHFSSPPVQVEKDGFVQLELEGMTTQALEPTKPVLPLYVKIFEIPFGSTNIQVTCAPQDVATMTLSAEILPAGVAPLSLMSENMEYVKDASVYGSDAFYPEYWYDIDLGAGRNVDDQQVTFVKVVCYPVRYLPLNNMAEYVGGFEIHVKYDAPRIQQTTRSAAYDMVVIAPSSFEAALQPLIDFKNGKGVATMFKSVEVILAEYDGFDPPEQVKYFIKDAYDTWGITYVLLVGGLKSYINANDKETSSAGYTDWWVPVRYVNIPETDFGFGTDEGCLCDLYYGCLYNATGTFDSWDSNKDGVYAQWRSIRTDVFDLYPEVYVARLPCVTSNEVNVVVDKILTYESTSPDSKQWYKTFIGVGGCTSRKSSDGKFDGEYLCDLAYTYTKNAIPDLQQVTCYASNRDSGGLTPEGPDIIYAINQGAGFLIFQGHGNPNGWATHWSDDDESWTSGLGNFVFPKIKNIDKLPVVVVGGCHNALYNRSLIPCIKDKTMENYFGGLFPRCFCWGLVVKPRGGGAVASIGNTGFGYGSGTSDPVGRSAELNMNFFWQIGNNNVTNLANAHSQAIIKYLNENDIKRIDAFCITNWQLFGDPSLRFGGYS